MRLPAWRGLLAALLLLGQAPGGPLRAQQLVADPALREQVIWAAVPDPAGWVWLATERGAFRYDGRRLVPLAALVAAGPRPGSGPLTAALLDSAGTLWLGGAAELWAYELRTRRLRRVPLPRTAAGRPGVTALAQYRGRLWVSLGTDPFAVASLPLGPPAAPLRVDYRHPDHAVVAFATGPAGQLEALSWQYDHQLAGRTWTAHPGPTQQQVLLTRAGRTGAERIAGGRLPLPGGAGRWELRPDGLYDTRPPGRPPGAAQLLAWRWPADELALPLLHVVEADSTWYWAVGPDVYALNLRGGRAGTPPAVWHRRAPLPFGRELVLVPLPGQAALLGFRRDAAGAVRLGPAPQLAERLAPADGRGLSTRSLSRLADGGLWVSAYEGLYRQAPDSPRAPLRRVAPPRPAGVWYSTLPLPGGQTLVADELERFARWLPSGHPSGHPGGRLVPLAWGPPGPPGGEVRGLSLLRDQRGRYWGGAVAGLFELDVAGGRMRRYRAADPAFPLHGCRIEALAEAPAGVLWAATNRGLYRLDVASGRCRRYGPGEPGGRALPTADLRCLLVPHPDSLWLGTFDQGLLLLLPRRGAVRRLPGLPSASVVALAQSGPGTLWAGTYRGLAYCRPRGGQVRVFTTADGLATDECNRRSLWYDARAQALYVGGVGGVSRLALPGGRPAGAGPGPPRLLLAALRRQDPAGAHPAVTYPAPGQRPALALNADDAFLDLELALPAYAPGQAGRFAYRLVAAGEAPPRWLGQDTLATVRLQHLAAGAYTLQVRAETGAGQPAANELALPLTVRPPWQRRPLTWALAALAGVVGVGAAVYGWQRGRAARLRAEQQLRARLAADLHDEVGNLLTRVTLHAELARELPEPAQLDELLRESRSAAATVRDLIWTVDTSADTAGALADRLQDVLSQGAHLAGRAAHFSREPEPFPAAARLRPDVRQHVYLVGREALTNALKHAPPRAALYLTLRVTAAALELDVWQDGDVAGRGPAAPAARAGQGLRNMAARAGQLGGTLPACGPTPDGGWRVALRVPRPLA